MPVPAAIAKKRGAMMASLPNHPRRGASVNKTLAVAVVLLGALAVGLATNQSAPTTFLGPRVVATVNLTNQTESIPTTTIFRPPVSGLYRASVYMTNTVPGNGAYS